MANYSIDQPISLDNQVRVSTPENISFQYEITGPSRRLCAYLADVFFTISIFLLISFSGVMLFALIASLLQGAGIGPMLRSIGDIAYGLLLAMAFLSMWFYGAFMETYYNGQTWGKMISNIRTISVDGSSIDGAQATLRNFFRLLDVSPFISLGLLFGADFGYAPIIPTFAFGLISMTISPKFQRVGDLVAGTMVVTEEKKWAHDLATFDDPRVPKLSELIPDHFVVNRNLARTLAEYVDRR
ncbi:MAG: RDD family protein, partial [Planctomycetota bacterium]